jgi:hypothetical protein
VHADRALRLTTTPAKQPAQVRSASSTVCGSTLTASTKDFDGAIRLLVQQEVQALEVRARQGARLLDQVADVDSRAAAQPKSEKDRENSSSCQYSNSIMELLTSD